MTQLGLTVERELHAGTRILDEAGVPAPRREATAIWAALTGSDLSEVWLRRQEEPARQISSRYRDALTRRISGEPLQYVLGSTGFRTLDLKVDERALIPRPETERMVDCVLAWGEERDSAGSPDWGAALDVGTGTGCIALSLAVEGKFKRVVATDLSSDALELAGENLELVAPNTPVELRHGSLLQPVAGLMFDVIVSNPPYVTESEHTALDVGVRDFEPRSALVGGRDGMDHIKELLESAGTKMTSGGLLMIEVDSTRAGSAVDLAVRFGWRDARIEADLFGRPRFLHATKES